MYPFPFPMFMAFNKAVYYCLYTLFKVLNNITTLIICYNGQPKHVK